jgi:hypothetical protein
VTITTEVDTDALPPTQYLILDVMQARSRMGETHWTFPQRLEPSARRLEDLGLVWLRSGPAEKAFEVWLTDVGRDLLLSKPWVSPMSAPVDRVRKLAEAAQAAGTMLLPSQVLAALGEAP